MNLKFLFIGLAILSFIGGIKFWYDRQIDAAFDRGAQSVVDEYKAKVEETNRQNREFEERMGSIINDYGISLSKSSSQRNSAELKQLNKIEQLIKQDMKYNTCEVDAVVTDARNKIRELGPKG